MNISQPTFPSLAEYLDALADNPRLAIVSKKMAAEALELSRPAIDAQIKDGRLATVKIGKVRHVLAWGLIEHQQNREEVVAKVRTCLEGVAATRSKVFYEPVMSLIGMSTRMPRDRDRIGGILGDISAETNEERGVLLSVLVHRKTSGTTRPSPAFFDLAESLGFEWDDDDAFIREQMERVWDAYAGGVKPAA